MKSNLRYYVLAVMIVICIVRLTYREQTLPTKPLETFTPTIEALQIQPTNPNVTIFPENNISTAHIANNTPLNLDSNIPQTKETMEEYSCVEPTDIKLIEETSIDELKAQGWRFPQKADYNSETYSEIKKYYKNSIEADFDNNGLKDKAVFMLRNKPGAYEEREQAIFVVLTQNQGKSKTFHMDAGEGLVFGGLVLQKAELLDLGDCKIDLQHPAISISYYESCGGQIMYWDKEQGRFLSIYTGC